MRNEDGFTVVELLVTLVVGLLLLFSAYQLYVYVLDNSADMRMRASASSLAYQFMRENSDAVTLPCTAITISPAPTVPASYNLPAATASVTISCISGGPVSVSIIKSTVSYGTPQKTVTHSTYVSAR